MQVFVLQIIWKVRKLFEQKLKTMAKFQKLCAYSMHWLKKEVSVAFLRNIYVKSAKKLTVAIYDAFICIIGG